MNGCRYVKGDVVTEDVEGGREYVFSLLSPPKRINTLARRGIRREGEEKETEGDDSQQEGGPAGRYSCRSTSSARQPPLSSPCVLHSLPPLTATAYPVPLFVYNREEIPPFWNALTIVDLRLRLNLLMQVSNDIQQFSFVVRPFTLASFIS